MYQRFSTATSILLLLILLGGLWLPQAQADTAIPADSYRTLTQYNPAHLYYPDASWLKAATPELLGWSSAKLAAARAYTRSLNTSAVVIVDNGVIVDEWGSPLSRYKQHSVRKSLMNALFGIHIAAGTLKLESTLEQLGIDDWNPPLTREEKQARLVDLLRARSGVYHPAAYETPSMRNNRPARGSHLPGTYWFYNNWDFNALITILDQHTGNKMPDDFYNRIARPLQMEQFRPTDTRYLYEPQKSRHPAFLILMSARDLARFGLLYLRNGHWQGQQLLTTEWVHESTTSHIETKMRNHLAGYGYLWWVSELGFAAVGSGGQTLMVLPEERLIIVHLADKLVKNDMQAHAQVAHLIQLILAARLGATQEQNLSLPPKNSSHAR